ncbi:glutathione S-transferase [Oxalobacteraceae bacterium CAVE-383]|nr:glutathione S-transferase [Oxalobacteraceae bacterium CAVE-383]
MTEFQLHGVSLSGHCHRVELMLLMLGLPYRRVDAPAEVRNTPAFLRLNPLGQIPMLQQGDLALADSNAILVYLARQYAPGGHWLPEEPLAAAHVQRWLSIAAGEVMYGPAKARLIGLGWVEGDAAPAQRIAARLLAFMEAHLHGRDWLATEQPTIADIACYSYVAHAPEGRISLAPYPSVRAWLQRVEALPRFRRMPATPLPAAV